MFHRPLILIALALGSAGCSSKLTLQIPDQGGTVLAEQRTGDADVVYKLHPGSEGGPSINRYVTRTTRKASLGIRVSDIDSDLSKRIGATPGKGLYVEGVNEDGPAARGGLMEGDIILAMGGVATASVAQLGDRLAHQATPGVAIPFRVERLGDGSPAFVLDLSITPDGIEEPDTDNEAFALKAVPEVQQFTGLQLTEIPAGLARDIYGAAGPLTLVSGVVVGSPAYLSGVRRGDVIQTCDGTKVSDSGIITRALDQRLGRIAATDSIGPGTPLWLQVNGKLGSHDAEIELTDDLDESTRFSIPILFGYQSDLSSTRWSFLDFIFQFGGNYRGQYTTATSREPSSHTSLSLFPFGMFEFELSPEKNRYTILWLISWSTSR